MRGPGLAAWLMAGVLAVAGAGMGMQEAHAADTKPAAPAKAAEAPAGNPGNALCLGCHGNEGFEMPNADGKMRPLHVTSDKFGKSVHGKRLCTECHKDITEIPHQKGVSHKVSCVQCHEELWATAQKEGKTG